MASNTNKYDLMHDKQLQKMKEITDNLNRILASKSANPIKNNERITNAVGIGVKDLQEIVENFDILVTRKKEELNPNT